jgi:hypothetical protein
VVCWSIRGGHIHSILQLFQVLGIPLFDLTEPKADRLQADHHSSFNAQATQQCCEKLLTDIATFTPASLLAKCIEVLNSFAKRARVTGVFFPGVDPGLQGRCGQVSPLTEVWCGDGESFVPVVCKLTYQAAKGIARRHVWHVWLEWPGGGGASRSHDGHAKLSYCKVSRTYFQKT